MKNIRLKKKIDTTRKSANLTSILAVSALITQWTDTLVGFSTGRDTWRSIQAWISETRTG